MKIRDLSNVRAVPIGTKLLLSYRTRANHYPLASWVPYSVDPMPLVSALQTCYRAPGECVSPSMVRTMNHERNKEKIAMWHVDIK